MTAADNAGEAHRAAETDIPRLTQLLSEATAQEPSRGGAHLYGQPGRLTKPQDRLREALAAGDRLLLAGSLEGTLVGVALGSLDHEAPDGPLAVVEELYVQPGFAGRGVADTLLASIVEWARASGCTGVDVPALPGDRAAKNLCERSGFRARLLVMHRAL